MKIELLPAKTCCLIIDMQEDFISDKGDSFKRGKDITKIQKIITPLNKFLEEIGLKNIPIIFTKFITDEFITPANLLELSSNTNDYLTQVNK